MRVLSCFSGIGAHDLGLEWAGMQIVGQIENDEFCQEILKKHWAKVPKWGDITGVAAADIRRKCGRIDLITGGFPCQDISTAGKQAGIAEGQRSSLWWEMWRLIRELRPDWLLLENVPALRTNGADSVLASLEAIGYSCWSLVVGAWHAGAAHKRNRVWIIAHNNGSRLQGYSGTNGVFPQQLGAAPSCPKSESECIGSNDTTGEIQSSENLERELTSGTQPFGNGRAALISDTDSKSVRKQPRRSSGKERKNKTKFGKDSHRFARAAWADVQQHSWEEPRTIEPEVGGTVYGLSRRLALKALGNANPPIMAYLMGKAIQQVR